MCKVNNKKVSSLMKNGKTLKSVDFSTDCPKRREGNPCEYCYVENARKIGCNAKIVHDYIQYKNEILRLSQKTIETLNSFGGVRLFSFGDYIPEIMREDIKRFLIDCRTKKLQVKVITKQINFISDFYKEFEDVFSVIHVSIDNIGNGVPLNTARALRSEYKKVLIRCVVLSVEDLKSKICKYSDIITLNHGFNGFLNFNCNAKVSKVAKEKAYSLYESRICCSTGRCDTCNLKCGVNTRKEGF